MSSERFFADDSLAEPTVELAGGEARHLADVLRKRTGEAVIVFNGRGREADAEVASIKKRRVELRILTVRDTPPDDAPAIVLATAVPKGDRFRWLIEKATELGVQRFVPLVTDRSIVAPGDGKLDKMRQTVIAACKQAGRNRLMTIDSPTSWDEFVNARSPHECFVVAHPTGNPPAVGELANCRTSAVVCVGPEGGFTDREIEHAVAAGAQLVCLGRSILRVETASIVIAGWFRMQNQPGRNR